MPGSALPALNVSRETLEDLKALEALVLKWTKRINLISKQSEKDLADRHIADSAQLWPLVASFDSIVDFGSGGGFPGLVLAVLAKHSPSNLPVTLVESDRRKTTFLQTAVRSLGLNVRVLSDRIESLPPLNASAITARALASCDQIFQYAIPHLRPDGRIFLLKGERANQEIAEARAGWQFSLKTHQSQTHSGAVILEIGDLSRA